MNRKDTITNNASFDLNQDDEQEEEDDTPFFADATLDLEEAQGIAMTPDAGHIHKMLTLSNPEFRRLEQTVPLPQLISTSSPSRTHCSSIDDENKQNEKRSSITDVSSCPFTENYQDEMMVIEVSNTSTAVVSGSPNNFGNVVSNAATTGATASSSSGTGVKASTTKTRAEDNQDHKLQNGSLIHHQNLISSSHHPNTSNSKNDIQYQLSQDYHRPIRPPRRPRDVQWIVWFLFLALLPLAILPTFVRKSAREENTANSDIQKVNFPIILTAIVAIVIARIFYLSRGGGEGEDRRYFSSQILIVANMIACFILPVVTLIFCKRPVRGSFLYNSFLLVLTYVTMKDIYTFAKLFRNTRIMREGVNDGQRTLFRMLVNASLDVLSRSLKCQSIYRVVVLVIVLQLGVIMLIKRAIASVIHLEGIVQKLAFVVLGAMGYWVTGVCKKLLSYLACGGITTWFAHQSALLQETERMKQRRDESLTKDKKERGDGDNSMFSRNDEKLYTNVMPEAYRNVDASAYSLGIEIDEGMDDDYDDDYDDMFSLNVYRHANNSEMMATNHNTLTVKAMLKSALMISFGSIIHCALLGGAANFLWSMLRTIEGLNAPPTIRYQSVGQETFQEMDIGRDRDDSSNLRHRILTSWLKFIVASKCFVRNHNDLALTHVGVYYKNYTRAANDVMALVIASGIEPIIQDDISFHMCASISKAISGIVVILIRQIMSSSTSNNPAAMCEILVVSFIMCYTIISTMMEPLQASIKAMYICFAHNSQSFSQVFPLVYHRLNRMGPESIV